MKWRLNATIVSLVAMWAILCALLISPAGVSAQGDHPYVGGYFDCSKASTSGVLACQQFIMDASKIPTNQYMMALISVAGASGSSPTGYIYQNPVTLVQSNSVTWDPQVWLEDQLQDWYSVSVGTGSAPGYYTRVSYSSSHQEMLFTCFAYRDWTSWYNDTPYIYSWYGPYTGDTTLWYGRQTHLSEKYKHFQWGVESSVLITQTAWQVVNQYTCYHDSGTVWKYKNAKVCNWYAWPPTYPNGSLITWDAHYAMWVGSSAYTGASVYFTQPYEVIWKYIGGGSTPPDEYVLWSGSGTISDSRVQPYSTNWGG
jgi:hypothetical protein